MSRFCSIIIKIPFNNQEEKNIIQENLEEFAREGFESNTFEETDDELTCFVEGNLTLGYGEEELKKDILNLLKQNNISPRPFQYEIGVLEPTYETYNVKPEEWERS